MNGADDLLRRLNQLKEIRQEIADEVEDTATNVEIDAIRAAPVSIGQKISKVATNGGLSQSIEVNAGAIGAYIEFGTGSSAASLVPTLPDEWQSIARSFYINGRGRLIANPYLYPAWFKYTTGFTDRIKKILDKAVQ